MIDFNEISVNQILYLSQIINESSLAQQEFIQARYSRVMQNYQTTIEFLRTLNLIEVKKGTIIVGSVHDPYQPAEKKYNITKKLLQIIKKHDFPCHILTKSTDILQDISLIKTMTCMVTISLPSLNPTLIKHFEPHTPIPRDRLKTLSILQKNKIPTGIALIPFFPFLIS